MKTNKSYIFSLIFAALTVFSGNVWGVDASAYKTATFTKASFSKGVSGYSGTSFNSTTGSFVVNIANANNNNKGWDYIKIGGSAGAYTGTIITDAAIDKKITRVELAISAITSSKVTSIKLYKSTNKSSWTQIGTFDKSTGTKVVNISAANQAANLYYKIEAVCQKGSSNGLVTITGVKFYRSTFTVSYNANGGSGTMTDSSSPYDTASVVTVKTNTFTAPANKAFDGWKTGASSGTSYAAGATFNISANTTLYAQWISTAACEATPTVGAASLSGSSFSLTSVGVQCASASAGDNCELEEWGFVWGESNASGRPNYFDDNVLKNTGSYSANYTNTISSTFSTGTTYYYRGYAVNGNDDLEASVGYSSEVKSFTPQEVLFYDNKELAGDEYDYKVVNNGTKVTPKGTPSKTGYTFAGWKNSVGDAAFDCSTTNVTTDLILYADWTVNSHTLTWSTDGDALSGDYTGKSGKVNYGTTIVAPNTPMKTGYTFKAWSPTVAGTMPDNDVTYTATWTANKYNITYKDQGDVAFSGTHTTGYPMQHTYGTATTLSTATKTGYTFGGWYTSSDCSTGLVTSLGATDYTAGMTLYAKWNVKSCTVVFDKQEGAEGSDNATATYGQALPDITAPTRLHYIFQGYYDAATNGTKYYNADGTSAKNWDKDVTANTTLYAHWTEHTYTNYRTLCCTSWDDPTVSYSSSSISVNGTATVTITGTTHGTVSYESSNESVLTVASNGTVTGVGAGTAHVIVSWTEADEYCEKTMNSEDITVQGNVTVVFHANNDTEETMDNQSIPVNEATALSANEFTAPSCKYFYGWATSKALADAGTRAYEDEESVTITEGMNLYAIWKTYRYTIATPTKVGAATATLDVAEVDCDGEVTVTSTADDSHKGDPKIEITPSDAGTVNGNKIENIVKNITAVTVTYAAKEVYTVTWKVGNDALEGDDLDGVTVSVTEGNGLETLPTNPSGTTLSGADTFMGWSKSELSGLGNSAPSDLFTAAGDEPTIDGNVTYHAVFATQTSEESDSWDLVDATANVTEGDYVITWNNSKYLPSETAADKNPSAGTGITQSNNKLTNTVTSAMQWSFAGDNSNGWTIRHTKQSTTYYLGATNTAQGIKVTTSEENGVSYLWTVSIDATDGMLLSAVSGRSLAVLSSDWRNYSSSDYDGTMRLYKHNVTEAAYANYITKVVALSSIAVTTPPTKTVYKKGATLDLTNMVVTATYADASTRAVTDYTVDLSGTALATTNTKFVVTYEENGVTKTAEQAINVYALSRIAITTNPSTTTYKSGATLSTEGMVVTATWGGNAADAFSEAVTGYEVDLNEGLVASNTQFTVSYTHEGVEKTTTQAINVYDLSSIAITTAPDKTTYQAGEVFDPEGMVVKAVWGINDIVENNQTGYTYPTTGLVNDTEADAVVDVEISYTSNGVTKTAIQKVTVSPKPNLVMTWHVADATSTTRIYVNDQSKYILALPSDPDPEDAGFSSDYVFKGWTTATSVKKDGSDFTKATAGTEMSADADFYAVFAQKNGEDTPAGYRLVDEAPANNQTVIIARKVNSTYYAFNNTAGSTQLTITNGVVASTTSVLWDAKSATSGVYMYVSGQSTNLIHMNSSSFNITNGATNGDIVFSSNGDGTYKATRADGERWIVTSGTNGFGCSGTEANAAALYIFKYAAATVATYSNYRLAPSNIAAPTGLEAGTYYCESKSITLSQAAGKPIYYTLDGSTPDNTKTLYSSAIVLNTSKTIKAVAYDSETEDYSGVASAEYTIVTAIDAPTMTASQNFFEESMSAEISHSLSGTEGFRLQYSFDGSHWTDYTSTLTITETKTVYAKATIGSLTSEANATYTKGKMVNYKKVTSDAGLAVGMKFIIVSGTNGAGAMTSNYLNVVTIPSPNEQSEIAITNQAVKVFTLSGRSGAYQLLSDEGTLGSSSAKSLNYNSNGKNWTISYSEGQSTIHNTTADADLKYNSGSPRFNTYASGQTAVDIYAIPFTAHTLTIKGYNESNKLTAKVVEGGSFVLTSADSPSSVPTGCTFADKWSDGTRSYAVGEAVTVNGDITLNPCWKVTPTADTDIKDLPAGVTDIEVSEDKTLTIDETRTLEVLTVEDGGTVKVETGNKVETKSLTLQTTSSTLNTAGKSGQLTGEGTITVDDLFLEIKLREGNMDAAASRLWYCISAPFNVDINGGFFWGNGDHMIHNTDFQLFEWDGDRRAKGISGWQRVSGTMQAGVAYFIGFDDDNTNNQNTIKLKANTNNNTISNKVSINAPGHNSEVDNDTYGNWNGLANPNYHHIGLDQNVQVFDYNEQKFNPYDASESNYVVGTSFFIQFAGNIGITELNEGKPFYAPKRESETYSYCVRIRNTETGLLENRIFVKASENASSTYDEEKEMLTLNDTTSAIGALIWTSNYGGKHLAIEEAPLINSQASYALTMFTKKSGSYSIELGDADDNANIYLTKNGAIIWNLTKNPYTIEMEEGTTEGYGLILVKRMPQDVETVSGDASEAGVQKVVINDKVFILRGEKMYDVTGKAVR